MKNVYDNPVLILVLSKYCNEVRSYVKCTTAGCIKSTEKAMLRASKPTLVVFSYYTLFIFIIVKFYICLSVTRIYIKDYDSIFIIFVQTQKKCFRI